VTDPDTGQPLPPVRRRRFKRTLPSAGAALSAGAVLAAYAVAGIALSWVWFWLWGPADGQVFSHQWYASSEALRGDFSGTGLYVLLALGGGAVLGILSAMLGGRQPLVTTIAAVLGSLLAGWLMLHLGQGLGPADPRVLAKTADDGTQLPSALRVTGTSPRFAFTMGTLAALAFVFTIFPGKDR
jgi:hypothetical protein